MKGALANALKAEFTPGDRALLTTYMNRLEVDSQEQVTKKNHSPDDFSGGASHTEAGNVN